jgi:DNA-binding Lrp family transcriptional regulator
MKAYVLIHGSSEGVSVARQIEGVPGVVSADDLTGAFDAIAVADIESSSQLVHEVIGGILAIPGVTRALPVPLVPFAADGQERAGAGRFEPVEAA